MCTKFPNWQTSPIEIGQTGFVKFRDIRAGDNWYDIENGTEVPYKYDMVQFIDFILDKPDSSNYCIMT